MARKRPSAPPSPPENATRTAFGQWLQDLRQQRGLGVRELGLRIGKEHSYIYAVETGRLKEPPIDVLLGLSRELGVPLLEMVRRVHGSEVEQALRQSVTQERGVLDGLPPEVARRMAELAETLRATIPRQAEAQARAALERLLGKALEESRSDGVSGGSSGRFWSQSPRPVPASLASIIPFPLHRRQSPVPAQG